MNDRYLYRAKRTDNGEWVEGNRIDDGVTGQVFIHAVGNSVNESDRVGEEGGLRFVAFEVEQSSICQCTGLKDKNGKLIWENDICERKEEYPEIVKYNDGDWTLDYSYASNKESGFNYCNLGFYARERKCVEVIGNIFDNQELLEKNEPTEECFQSDCRDYGNEQEDIEEGLLDGYK